MKKITTVFAIIATAFALSTMAFGQNGKGNKRGVQGGITSGRQATGTPTGSVTFGKVKAPQAKLQRTSPREFDRGYLPPNAVRGYSSQGYSLQGIRNNLTVNSGSGNDTISTANVQRRTAKPNRVVGDWDGDGAITVGRRRNFGHFAGPLDHAQINGNLKTSGANQRNNALEGSPDQPIISAGASANGWQQNNSAQRRGYTVSGQGSGDPIPTEIFSSNRKAAERNQLRGEEWRDWGVNKNTSASGQPTGNNANTRVKKPRRYMEQDGLYR